MSFIPLMAKRLARSARLLMLSLLCVPPTTAQANGAIATAVDSFVRSQTIGLPGQVDITVTPPDARTPLAHCSSFDPFVPPGNKLWGKTMVGVRCLGPASWTIYLPVQVRVTGSYVITTRAIGPGQVLTESDLSQRQGDLTAMPAGLLAAPELGVGKTLKNGVAGGQPLRADMLLATPVIVQGQDVRIIYKGSGFSISNEGKALNSAAEGQTARARTPGGQTVSGIARPGGVIEVNP